MWSGRRSSRNSRRSNGDDMPRKRSNARQRAIRALDAAFSEYIRFRSVDEHGQAECYTCGKRDHPRALHCGHFASRRYMATRWHEDNCRVQCPACNIFRQGEQYRFGRRLDSEDQGLADRMLRESQRKRSYSITQLEQLTRTYRERSTEYIQRAEALANASGRRASSVPKKGKKKGNGRKQVPRRKGV